ncbi:MAG: hypothetical protein JWO02_634 [Solirubrobacterales bacterium]|nr:hypothetical protein [Solirubrobacterales bacterium]
MENATLTPRRQGPEVPKPADGLLRARLSWAALAFALLTVITLVITLAYPTYPNYDTVYSLLWGREILHGVTPSFDAYRAPTEHPLAIAFGMLLSLLGESGDRAMVFAALASFLALTAGLYRLGRVAFTPAIGFVAALILCSRLDFPFLALRGYIDVTYLAFVVWAAALEGERPRTGYRVPVLLAGAALMRPEAWLIAGLYFLYAAWPADWARRVRLAVLAAVGPVVWVALDFAVTGKPLFSLQHTSGLAEELGRTRSASQIPSATFGFLKGLDTPVVFYVGLIGVLLALFFVPRRVRMPMALLVVGVGTFFLVGAAGLSVIDRYLLVASLMLMLFAAVTVAGWSLLNPGRLRIAWIVLGALVLVVGAAHTSLLINRAPFFSELTFRGEAHAALVDILKDPVVRKARSCGPISTPSHKLIPEVRWIADAPEDQVLARNDPRHSLQDRTPGIASDKATARGLALLVTTRQTLLRQAVVDDTDTALDNIPPAGFRRLAFNGTYAIYTSC